MKKRTAKVVWVGGIYEKEVIATEHAGIYKLYSERNDERPMLYIEFDGHLWPSIDRMEDALRLQPTITRQFIEDNWEVTTSRWQHQFKIHLGLAEYLDKLEEGKALQAKLDEWRNERDAEYKEKVAARRQAAIDAHEAALAQAAADLLANKEIAKDYFLELCKRHNIEMHLRTHGWIKSSLVSIGRNSYTSHSRSGKIAGVRDRLIRALEAQ